MKNSTINDSEQITLSFKEWIHEYQPILDNEGLLIDIDPRYYDHISPEEYANALIENRVWSEHTNFIDSIIVNKELSHCSNETIGYFITKKQYNPSIPIIIK